MPETHPMPEKDPPETHPNGEEAPRVREMIIDDLSEVFHIGEELFTAEYSQSLYRTWDEYEITTLFNSDNELCLVAEQGEKLLGFALGTTVKKHNSPWKYGYLVWLGVRREIQKLQVGERLFKEIRRRMKEQGVRMIIIDTSANNRPAIRFFEKHGFDNIQEHVYMTLNLSRKHKKKAVKKP
jgi:ribosomal protein S18 acetylase RimI-like enzyme